MTTQTPEALGAAHSPGTGSVRRRRTLEALIVVGALTAGLAGGVAVTRLRTPVYEATAQLLVTPVPRDDSSLVGLPLLRDLGDPIRTIETAAAVLDSREIAEAVARSRARWTIESVQQSVDVAPLGQTNVLVVSARHQDPEEATRLAIAYTDTTIRTRQAALRAVARQGLDAAERQLAVSSGPAAEALQERITDLQLILVIGDPTLSVSQTGAVPQEPAGPSYVLVLALATAAGLGAGLVAVMALRAFQHRGRTAAADHPAPIDSTASTAPPGRPPVMPPTGAEAVPPPTSSAPSWGSREPTSTARALVDPGPDAVRHGPLPDGSVPAGPVPESPVPASPVPDPAAPQPGQDPDYAAAVPGPPRRG